MRMRHGDDLQSDRTALQISDGDRFFRRDAPADKELARVCKLEGRLIIPTYINEKADGGNSLFIRLLSKLGADFKRQFTAESYRQFFLDAGFPAPEITIIKGRIPCAVAVLGDGQHAGNQS